MLQTKTTHNQTQHTFLSFKTSYMFWLQYIAINRLHAFDYTQMVGIYYSCFFLNLSRTYVVFDQSYVVLF
jgi:hypothetical protein